MKEVKKKFRFLSELLFYFKFSCVKQTFAIRFATAFKFIIISFFNV